MYAVLVLLLIFVTAATNTQRRNNYTVQKTEVEPIPESVHKYIEAYADAFYKAKTAEFSKREGAASYNMINGERKFKNEVKRLEAIHEAAWFRDYVRSVDPKNRFVQRQSEEEYAKAAKTPSQLDNYMYENLNMNTELFNKWHSRLNLDIEIDFHLTTIDQRAKHSSNHQTNSQPKNVNDIQSEFRKLEQEYYKQKAQTNKLLELAVHESLNSRHAINAAWDKVKLTKAVINVEDQILDYVEIIEDYQWDLEEIEKKIRAERGGRAKQKLLQMKKDVIRKLNETEVLLNRTQKLQNDFAGKTFAEDVEVKRKDTQSNQALNKYYSHLWDLRHKVMDLEVQRIEYLKSIPKSKRIAEMKRAMEEEIDK
ncbi:unnamed protein product [Trichobilharzia szidati]|nr:unnamed protein product [Trichobilharzia szidati]